MESRGLVLGSSLGWCDVVRRQPSLGITRPQLKAGRALESPPESHPRERYKFRPLSTELWSSRPHVRGQRTALSPAPYPHILSHKAQPLPTPRTPTSVWGPSIPPRDFSSSSPRTHTPSTDTPTLSSAQPYPPSLPSHTSHPVWPLQVAPLLCVHCPLTGSPEATRGQDPQQLLS